MKIVVIGSGFGGLSAAIRLQARGHQVVLLEKRDKPGGRAYVYEQDGFKFDGGPTMITAPALIDELFELGRRKTADYIELIKLDPFYNIRFADGAVFNYSDDQDFLCEQISRLEKSDARSYMHFRRDLKKIYRFGSEYVENPFARWQDLLRALPQILWLRLDQSAYKFVSRYFQDERLRQAFSFHPFLIGGNPFAASSLFTMFHGLEQEHGVWFARGGTGALVRALCDLLIDLGGEIFLKAEVEEIFINRAGEAGGVRLKSGDFFQADAVVCNADLAHAYLNLIKSDFRRKYTDRKIKSMSYSPSLFVYYFGTDKKYENLAHHEILLGSRYRESIDKIFHQKTLADDLTLYLHHPTVTDRSLAPDGCDCWYALAPVPNLGSQIDWTVEAEAFRDRIVRFLEDRCMPDLSRHIVTEHRVDPLHFQNDLNCYLGSAFSLEPTWRQSAFFRPHHQSEDIPNLYFVGAGTHPGAGLPGVMSSGKIVANMIGNS